MGFDAVKWMASYLKQCVLFIQPPSWIRADFIILVRSFNPRVKRKYTVPEAVLFLQAHVRGYLVCKARYVDDPSCLFRTQARKLLKKLKNAQHAHEATAAVV